MLCLAQLLIAQNELGSANPNVYVSPEKHIVLIDRYNAWIYDTAFHLTDSFLINDETQISIDMMNSEWSQDGSKFAISFMGVYWDKYEGTSALEIWDFQRRQRIAEVSDILGSASIAWSPDSTQVATIHQADRFRYSVRIFDLHGSLRRELLVNYNVRLHIYFLVWLTDELIAVTTDGDEEKPAGVKIIDITTGQVLGNIPDANIFMRPAYNPQLKLLAVPKLHPPNEIGIWSLNPLREVFTFEGVNVVELAGWREDKLLIEVSEGVQLWQLNNKQPISTIETGSFLNLPLFIDDTRILIQTANELQIRDTKTGEILARLDTNDLDKSN